MPAAPAKAVIFDIDGTLSPILSWLEFTKTLGASTDRHQAIFRDYLDERITYEQSRTELLALWQATGRAHLSTMQQIFDQWPLHAAAAPLIAGLKNQGAQVCLMTGSFDLYAATVARKLSVEQWYANTRLIFAPDGSLQSYDYVRDQAAHKLRQLNLFLEATELSVADCVAVGDGPNDVALFRATGRGILVEPAMVRDDLAEVRAAAWKTVGRLDDVAGVLAA